jgi:broad specificity phosphatase PhoE
MKMLEVDLFESISMENRIYIVRHGSTKLNGKAGNSDDRIRGHIDVPLDSQGIEDAKEAAKKLEDKGITLILSSDLKRASETAEIIAEHIGAKVITDYAFRPWKLGNTIEGQLTKEVLAKIAHYVENPDERPPENAETFNEFLNRFLDRMNEVEEKYKNFPIAIVTHFRCFKVLEARIDRTNQVDLKKFLTKGDDTGTVKIVRDGHLAAE